MSWLNRLFNNNRFLMVLSFLSAVIIWFTVSIVYSPQSTRSIAGVPIEISFSDEDAGYQAYSAAELFAKVEVKGKKYVVEQLSADSLTVSATVESVTSSGMYTLDLTAKKRTANGDYTVGSVSPSTINVMIDVERTLQLPVEIVCEGASVPDVKETNQNLLLEPTFLEEGMQTVTVTGPETQVSKIATCAAVAKVNEELAASKEFTAGILLYDADGNVLYDAVNKTSSLDFVTLSYETAPIVANVNLRKVVPLKFAVEGAPQSAPKVSLREITGSQIASDNQVSSIGIKGAVDVISKIENITLDGTVDFSKIDPSTPLSYRFELQLPTIAGVTYDEYTNVSDLYFVALVEDEGISSRAFDIPASQIKVNGLPAGFSASVKSALKGVTVVGPANEVRWLSASDLQAQVDASSVTASGALNLNAQITVTGSNSCWISGGYQVVVETAQK